MSLIWQKDKEFARPVNRRFKVRRRLARHGGDSERGIASSVKREANKQDRIEPGLPRPVRSKEDRFAQSTDRFREKLQFVSHTHSPVLRRQDISGG